MPREDQHLQQARGNERFADSLDLANPVNVGWAITSLFYAAVHYVDAHFIKQSIDPPNHEKRKEELARDPILRKTFFDYKELEQLSRNARYECFPFTARDVALRAKPRLEKVKSAVSARP